MVRIALADRRPLVPASEPAALWMPATTSSIGSWVPITPVDATSTCEDGTPSAAPASATIVQALSRPAVPVQALAEPELVTIARARPPWIWARLTVTGAATTRLVVNTPAAVAGRSETSRVRSDLPLRFMPQAATPAANPAG